MPSTVFLGVRSSIGLATESARRRGEVPADNHGAFGAPTQFMLRTQHHPSSSLEPPMLIAHLAFLLAAAFTGAAVYVAAVEQPARLALGNRGALAQGKPSYARGKVMQAALAAFGGALAFWTWWNGGGPLWLAAGIVLLAP